jgi:HD-like signal output (HDOD) protein
MRIICPICHFKNHIEDDDVAAMSFSFLCEECSQLLSVKVVVEALSLVKTEAAKEDKGQPKNRVSDYIRENFNEINLPVLPVLATKIREAQNNPKCSINDIVDLVRTDQIIASKILALANSAAYGGLVEITDLKRAIIKLGLSTTEMLVQALENRRIYSSDNLDVQNMLKDLWLHALGVALTAQTIAKELNLEDTSTIFTAGLMHDFGYILFIHGRCSANHPTPGALAYWGTCCA